jgi:hypothetical protein
MFLLYLLVLIKQNSRLISEPIRMEHKTDANQCIGFVFFRISIRHSFDHVVKNWKITNQMWVM